jgi:NAD(P)H-hydrate epimerase
MDQPIEQLDPADDNISDRINSFTVNADMLVDGLFGTGLRGQLSDEYQRLIEGMNACRCPIFAVDIPSGLGCDSGEPLGAAVQAAWTVTFVAVKKGFTFPSASPFTGEIFVASIGVNPR